MFKNLNSVKLNIVIGLILFSTTLIGYFYVNSAFVASMMWPTTGFIIGLYYVYGKKALPGLIIGIFIANLLARFVLIDELVYLTISTSIVFTIGNVIQALIFKRLIPSISVKSINSIKKSFWLIGVSLIVSVIGAIISVSFIYLTHSSSEFLFTLSRWVFGDFSSILVFTIPIVFSYHYDNTIIKTKTNFILALSFIIIFTVFSYLVFGNTMTFNYFSVLFLLFCVISILFSYKMIIMLDIIYIIMYHLFLIFASSPTDLMAIVFTLNIYLVLFSNIALFLKIIICNLEFKNKQLEKSKNEIKKLLDSTKILFKLSGELLDTNTEITNSYLIQMFNIAINMLDNFEYASLYVKSDNYIKYIDCHGYDLDVLNEFFNDFDDFNWKLREPRIIKNPNELVKEQLGNKYEHFKSFYPKMKQSIRFNLYIKEDIVGGMSFDIMEGTDYTFTSDDVDNFRSYQKLMNSFYEYNNLNIKNNILKNDIVLSLIRTLELFDHYTGGHSEEVAYLSEKIAIKMGLSKDDVYNAYWSGIVHDIGKVGISSDIINKPSKLTLEEFKQIKKHPVFGYQILNKSEDLKEIAKFVKHHHEWWNGEGYPDGLKGETIPLISQILAVCDSVSSMATKRPYAAIKTSNEILKEIELYSGTQFSPVPADAMIKFIKEGLLDEFYKHRYNH